MGTGILAQSIEYKPGFGSKQMAWMLHASVMGAMLAPLCFLGGPVLIRAAWYTAGVVGGLSAVAVSIFDSMQVIPKFYCIFKFRFVLQVINS